MKKLIEKIKEQIRTNRWAELLYLGLVLFLLSRLWSLLGMGCPIRFATGISCPGCGMSRAYMALLTGDVREAFHSHPLFWILPLCVILWLLHGKIPKRGSNICLFTIVALFVIVYLYRLLNESAPEIVYFHPDENIVFRLIRKFN